MIKHLTLLVVGLLTAAGVVLVSPASPANAADKDCGDFASQAAAQKYFIAKGGPQHDPDRLDADGDGIACEDNPGPYSYATGGGSTKPHHAWFGAIAVNPVTGKVWKANNLRTKKAAVTKALRACRAHAKGASCRTAGTARNQCVAVGARVLATVPRHRGLAVGHAAGRARAKKRALAKLHGPGRHVVWASLCTRG